MKPIQLYCNTVPLSYMTDERKLLFYRKISLSKNAILRTLMCLPGVSSDFMFLCSMCGIFGCIFAVLLSSRPGLGLEDTPWRSWPWHLRSLPWPWEKSLRLGKDKTFSPRSRLRGCCTCMLCTHSRCHITVFHFLLRNVSQTCMYIRCRL